MGNIKRSTARDFRINAASLEAALREIESEEEEEENENEDNGGDESVNGTLRTHQTNDNNNDKTNRSSVKEVRCSISYSYFI